jgi:hypothetical protein
MESKRKERVIKRNHHFFIWYQLFSDFKAEGEIRVGENDFYQSPSKEWLV